MTQVFRISNALREAFAGHFEDELNTAFNLSECNLSFDEYSKAQVDLLILKTPPEERLRVYLEWNGILGYAETIYSIAIGRLA